MHMYKLGGGEIPLPMYRGREIPDLKEFSQPPLHMVAKIVLYSNKMTLQSPTTPLAISLGP